MPKLTVVERDGELVIVSETEANGGPPDLYLGVRNDHSYEKFIARGSAEEFVKEVGGSVYMITHYWHNDQDGGEWLPQSYKIAEVSTA